MKQWVFGGVCDKSDFLKYVASVLSKSGSKVLLVDGTPDDIYQYSMGQTIDIPGIYEFFGFDIACGFDTMADVENQIRRTSECSYDYWLIDAGKPSFMNDDDWVKADDIIWVNNFSLSDLSKNSKWLIELSKGEQFQNHCACHSLLLNVVEDLTDDAYIDGLMSLTTVRWLGTPIRVPWDEHTYALKIENEHHARLKLKPLNRKYKRALAELIERLSEMEQRQIYKAFRQAERRRA
ncbi:hypothetical protein [Paenibacillus lemnae]|uniref:Uncharacterized protein n=1 Tax=Paenibacillus lemnae TaxID=1330551 RepID=A0A848M5C3_PAELE|nr:hypothetical protein [Paenibacillus lemnae]NMO95955.1 hypothetical protein [Paenibacillus lemnae]